MCSFKLIYFVIFVLNLYKIEAQISDKRLCADPECKEPVSLAKTLLRYPTSGPGILSFAPNEQVTVYSKEAGSVSNLWGVEIKGKRGYIPKNYVREYKIFKKPTLLVDTELKRDTQVPVDKKDSVKPDNVQETFEVVDGTTIYLNPQDSISPSTTASPVVPTAVPPSSKEVGDATETLKSAEGLKDNIAKNPEKESVVGNVLSSINNWIKDDATSEETDELEDDENDDEEDDDEDEEDEEEEDTLEGSEENLQKDSILQQPEDVNMLHNLPLGMSVSSYSSEVDPNKIPGSEKGEIETPDTSSSTETKPDEVKVDEEKTAVPETLDVAGKNDQNSAEATNISEAPLKPDAHIDVSSKYDQPPIVNSEVNSSDVNSLPELQPDAQKNATETLENTPNSETPETQQQETVSGSIEAVTETPETATVPTYEEDEEQKPIVDETTPNPVTTPKEPDVQVSKEETDPKIEDVANIESLKNALESSDPSPNSIPTIETTQNEISKDSEPSVSNLLPPIFGDFPAMVQSASHSVVEGTETEKPKEDIPVPEVGINADPVVEDTAAKENLITTDNKDEKEAASDTDDDSKEEISKIVEQQMITEEQTAEINNNEDTNDDVDIKEDTVVEEVKDEAVVENSDNNAKSEVQEVKDEGGLFSSVLSLFNSKEDPDAAKSTPEENSWSQASKESVIEYCDANSELCNNSEQKDFSNQKNLLQDIELSFNSDIFLYLLTTSISVIIFLFGYMILDRSRREGPLVARINKLEKELLITLKENELLQENGPVVQMHGASSEAVEQLMLSFNELQLINQALEARVAELSKELEGKEALEEQIESLEKELETSTEVGMELNRIISEMLDPTNGSEKLKENVEQLQRQLLEQKDTINTINSALREKESENQVVRNELEKSMKKSGELQGKLEEMVDKVLQIEKEKDQQQGVLQNELAEYHQKYTEAVSKAEILNNEIQILRVQLMEVQRQADIKSKENKMLQDSVEKIKLLKNDRDALRSLLDSTSIKAELQQLRSENENYVQQLQHETSLKDAYEKKYQSLAEEVNLLHQKYEQADKEKVEANSRLEVLNNYFKKREGELQEELIKYKSIWEAKEGEATSTTERIRYMQEEVENYKAQNETLKQEIVSQEIDLKSQISMLEKKVHENWVSARQTERKLEDARQEAAQLRNRLTLRERAQNRLQSPLEQNGELPLSPQLVETPASPPLLYAGRDHITKSPPIPGLPPFLPPPPGAPFMPPPPHGMPPFMPPPPSMFPGDHRPPPLGRMSSPPLNSRYSPDTSAFSPYDRNSPSPPYDSEYGTSPPPLRGYSPYNSRDDRRDYKRPPHVRTNGRNMKGSVISSGSEHSNDSLDKMNRKQSKMV